MSNVVARSFSQRVLAVATASMVMLSGIVLTAGPANANEMERVPYTYAVKVEVPKTVFEGKVVKKDLGNGRVAFTYERVAKVVKEVRIEMRTGYREVAKKVADKPAAAEFKVQVARDAAFSSIQKEIKVNPASSGANKVNLSSQLSGNVGDTAFVRVVAKNAAGKSTAGAPAKLTFGQVSTRYWNETESYQYQAETRAAGYRPVFIGYGTKPVYGNGNPIQVWVEPTYRNVQKTGYRTESYTYYEDETYKVQVGTKRIPAYTETYISGYTTETYRNGSRSVSYAYDCSYWTGSGKSRRYVSRTCYGTTTEPVYATRQVPVYSTRTVYDEIPIYETRIRSVKKTGTRSVPYTYTDTELVSNGYWRTVGYEQVIVGSETDYSNPRYEDRWFGAEYETRTGYQTVTRSAPVNGWKAATN